MLIRKTEPKPIRVFLQDGRNDQNNYTGSWFIANQDMLSALEFAGYDVNHEWGDGEHNSRHATALFPDALRWLWRDWPAPIKANAEGKSRQDVYQTLIPGEDWQLVSEGHRAHRRPGGQRQGGAVLQRARRTTASTRSASTARSRVFAENTSGANGMMFGPDGRLYAGATRSKQIVAYDAAGTTAARRRGRHRQRSRGERERGLYFTDSPGEEGLVRPEGRQAARRRRRDRVSRTA